MIFLNYIKDLPCVYSGDTRYLTAAVQAIAPVPPPSWSPCERTCTIVPTTVMVHPHPPSG